ncbi:hypothetical protein F9U64_10745 [Gracilibacillus oryzae]|uniref:Uncharacterized protein n=1 Tax=Gracilibacillus oryzae TaxID=1672701 RepID=A0A7C8GU52_9BACI|nr:hypothetical protein [Gracilibacillus oryzae]KAB8135744.1 hypothetical protein F9U64_10745 [Gracilibacillus oryzae]
MENIMINIIIFIVILFILYIIIETAVRRGINSSVIGQYLEKEHGIKERTSLYDRDLDDE